MAKKIFSIVLFYIVTSSFLAPNIHASEATKSAEISQKDQYYKASVVKVANTKETVVLGYKNFSQKITVRLLEGPDKGKTVELEHSGVVGITPVQQFAFGEELILIKTPFLANQTYSIFDRYRLNRMIYVVVGFLVLVIAVGGKKGVGAILGMIVSFFVLIQFVVPQILQGRDPILISIIGSLIILVITLYLAHGFSKKTTVALVSTFAALTITGIFSFIFVKMTHLSGLGSDDSFMLQFGPHRINLQGLLLGGMIIGALGVLDDITTTQSATIFEIKKANKKLTLTHLVERGFSVGKDHVASLVNTLVLAYAGASFTLFVLIVLNPAQQPYWVILNSEIIAQEVIRTIAGSIGLVLAVPITTLLASWVATKK